MLRIRAKLRQDNDQRSAIQDSGDLIDRPADGGFHADLRTQAGVTLGMAAVAHARTATTTTTTTTTTVDLLCDRAGWAASTGEYVAAEYERGSMVTLRFGSVGPVAQVQPVNKYTLAPSRRPYALCVARSIASLLPCKVWSTLRTTSAAILVA